MSSSWYQQMGHQHSYIFIIITNMHCSRTTLNYFTFPTVFFRSQGKFFVNTTPPPPRCHTLDAQKGAVSGTQGPRLRFGGGGGARKPDNLTVIHSKLIKHLQMCHGDGGESSIHQRPPSPRRNLAASQSNYANEGGTARDGGRWRGGVGP